MPCQHQGAASVLVLLPNVYPAKLLSAYITAVAHLFGPFRQGNPLQDLVLEVGEAIVSPRLRVLLCDFMIPKPQDNNKVSEGIRAATIISR